MTEPVTSPPVRAGVVEALLDGGRSFRVAVGHQVLPDLSTLLGAESVLESGQELGIARLTAPTCPEDRPDERGRRDDVVDRGRSLVDVVRLPVGGQTVGVGLGVGDDLLALLAVLVEDDLDLIGHELFGRRARRERLSARHQRERIDARNVGHCGARRTPAEFDQQPAVAGGDPAGAEGHVVAGLARDVRDAELVVEDRGPGPAGGLLGRRSDRLEVLREVEVLDVLVGHLVAQRGQAVVQRELVGRLVGLR